MNTGDYEVDFDDRSFTESEKQTHKRMWEASSTEDLIRGWGEKSGGLRWMHIKSADFWRRMDERMNKTNVLMSCLTSASSFLGSVTHEMAPEYIMVFVGIVGLLNVVTLSIAQYYNSSQKITLHETASKQFGHFNRFVATKLSLSRLERGDPREVLRYALRENERLHNENIDPHPSSVDAYKAFIANSENKFMVPDILNRSFAISTFDENLRNSGEMKRNMTMMNAV